MIVTRWRENLKGLFNIFGLLEEEYIQCNSCDGNKMSLLNTNVPITIMANPRTLVSRSVEISNVSVEDHLFSLFR